MSLLHSTISRFVVSGLIAERTDAEDRVFANRERPVWKGKLPALMVFTNEETAELRNVAPKLYARTLDVVVQCCIEGSADDFDERLDRLSDQVERFFFRDPLLGIPWQEVNIEDTWYVGKSDVVMEKAQRAIAAQRMLWRTRFLQSAPEGRDTDLQPLRAIGTNVDGAAAVIKLEGQT